MFSLDKYFYYTSKNYLFSFFYYIIHFLFILGAATMPKLKSNLNLKKTPKKVTSGIQPSHYEKDLLQILSTGMTKTTKEVLALTKTAKQLKAQLAKAKTKTKKTSKKTTSTAQALDIKNLANEYKDTKHALRLTKASQLKLNALNKALNKFEKAWKLKEAKQNKIDTAKELKQAQKEKKSNKKNQKKDITVQKKTTEIKKAVIKKAVIKPKKITPKTLAKTKKLKKTSSPESLFGNISFLNYEVSDSCHDDKNKSMKDVYEEDSQI
jgi:hypothetical protein